MAAMIRGEELETSLRAMFFQPAHDDRIGAGDSSFAEAQELSKGLTLGPNEEAGRILEVVGNLPDPLEALRILAAEGCLGDAVGVVEVDSEWLQFRSILAASPSEAQVCGFLDGHQHLLRGAVGCYHPGDTAICKREFEFGADFRADFLILYPRRSVAPILYFVEFEPVDDMVLTRRKTPSRRLLTAMRQIREWNLWASHNQKYFHDMLLRAFGGQMDPIFLERQLVKGLVGIESFIFIGRRTALHEKDYRELWADQNGKLVIHTHDSILDTALAFDLDRFHERAEWECRRRTADIRRDR